MTAGGRTSFVVKPWSTLAEKMLLETDRFRLTRETVQVQDGRVFDDYYQIHMGEAAVIAATRGDGRILLMRMYKHGPRRAGLGFPGGGIHVGEEPLAAARRELLEETGYGGGVWAGLGCYTVHSNQGCGRVHFFKADDVGLIGALTVDDLEPYEFVYLTRQEIRKAVTDMAFLSMGHVCMATLWLDATAP